jgi:hypothetical protein
MVSAPLEVPAEIVDDPLGPSVRFRRNRDINARDLSDLHRRRKLAVTSDALTRHAGHS